MVLTHYLVTYLREKERACVCTHVRMWAGGEGKSHKQTPPQSAEPDAGLDLMIHKIMTGTGTKSQTLNQLDHPGAPR